MAEQLSLTEAARRVGVSPSTLRRWARSGVIPEVDGSGRWSAAAVAHARIVARLRERVSGTLPEDARVVKTIGDEVMVDFEEIGQVKLKGFDDPRQLSRVSLRE